MAHLFGRYSSSPGYSSVCKAYADVRGAYAVRGFDSHDFFEGRFLVGFVEDFAVVEEQVNLFSFLDSDERKLFRKACRY